MTFEKNRSNDKFRFDKPSLILVKYLILIIKSNSIYSKPLELRLGGKGTQPHELGRTKRLG